MRRFLATALALLFLVVGVYCAVFYGGMYLKIPNRDLSVPFRTVGKELQVWDGASYAPLSLRGVEVSPSLPGHPATDFAADEADYLRWFDSIQALGANAIYVSRIMDDSFYNALYHYNTTHDAPLYLVQGFGISGSGWTDAYDGSCLGRLLEDGRSLVDIIHGRKNQNASLGRGGGSYRRDISPWTVGLAVGMEWDADLIAYTDHSPLRSGEFSGSFFQTAADASPFEAMLARVMEEITAYEGKKYSVQRPVGALCTPACDFLTYEESYARQLHKYAAVDLERILPTQAMAAGRFSVYWLDAFCDQFSEYLDAGQAAELAPHLAGLGPELAYGGYPYLIARRHTMPVMAVYGFSSARGAMIGGLQPLTEREQGEHLAEVSLALTESGWAGDFVTSWQDEWERRSWNTAFALAPARSGRWHDLQTAAQNGGLMAFEPGAEPVCVLDGRRSEWTEDDLLLESGGFRLSARQDAEGLYLLIEGVGAEDTVYLPIDVSPELGSRTRTRASGDLSFQRDADFVLRLDGPNGSSLLVQERYDAMRERFLFETEGSDPFASVPDKDSSRFVPIRMALSNNQLVEHLTAESMALRRLKTWETGRLVHGNGDSTAADYNSLADFCYGEGCVEVRLPWLLLNVADPSARQIHRDYYPLYGVELQTVRGLWLGVGTSAAEIPMAHFPLKGWRSVQYRERLKESYRVLQALWTEEVRP